MGQHDAPAIGAMPLTVSAHIRALAPRLSIAVLIREQALRHPDAVAILAPDRKSLTYGALFAQVERVAAELAGLGIGPNDRVAVVLPDGPEMAVAFVCVAARATFAPLNPAYGTREFEFYLSDLKPKALIVQAGQESPAIAVARGQGIQVVELCPTFDAAAGLFSLEGGSPSGSGRAGFAAGEDVALMLHTSGSTARPKLVPLTHTDLGTTTGYIRAAYRLTSEDRALLVMPLFHLSGLVSVTLSSLSAGASIVCAPGFLAPKFFEWMREFRPTWYSGVPTMHQALLARAEAHRATIASCPLRFIRSSSAPLSPQLRRELERVFQTQVIETYGMTECSPIASTPWPPRRPKPGTVGVPTGPEMVIMNESGHLLPPGARGEIVLRGPNVLKGYVNNPEANQKAFTNGWFRTGDQGFLDEEGYLTITGRIKEIISRGGEKISPREVDEVLLDHPAVAQVVTFAMPHPQLGEDVAAAVVRRPGLRPTEAELRDFAASRLAYFKVPTKVVFVEEIPKGPTGKLQRVGLAQKLGVTAEVSRTPTSGNYRTAPRTEAEKAIAGIWAEVLGLERVGVDQDFLSLGGDSVLAGRITTKVCKLLDVDLPLVTLFTTPTVAGMAETVERRRRSKKQPASYLVAIQTTGSRPPFFCLPGQGDPGFTLRRLVQGLGPDQPFFSFQLDRLVEDTGLEIEGLAQRFLQELRGLQPVGPYYLGGYSFGGLVAYEMAQQLQAQGEEVRLLALFDVRGPGFPRKATWPQLWQQHVRHWLQVAPREKIDKVGRAVQRLAGRRSSSRVGIEPTGVFKQLGRNYKSRIQVYRGRLTLLRAAEQPNYIGWSFDDPCCGWDKVAAGGVDVQEVPGGHFTILKEPHARHLAAQLSQCLEEAQAVAPVLAA